MQTANLTYCEDEQNQTTLLVHAQAVERAIQVMHTHLHEPLSLGDLAAAAYLSPSHFHRTFCHLTGVPPGEFLSALRFQMARRLLLTTTLSVTDVCFEVGYTSLGSFTSRFTRLVGLSPRLLRQRAHAFEPQPLERVEPIPMPSVERLRTCDLLGRIRAPDTFQGIIYVGLFASPVPQGAPVRCTKLTASGWYLLRNLADGVYYLRAAAFPRASDLQSSLWPSRMLVGNNGGSLTIRRGHITGDPNLVLHVPQVIDPPLVMGCPCFKFQSCELYHRKVLDNALC